MKMTDKCKQYSKSIQFNLQLKSELENYLPICLIGEIIPYMELPPLPYLKEIKWMIDFTPSDYVANLLRKKEIKREERRRRRRKKKMAQQ